ncbi:WD40 repeat-like protein [Gyrodon lividus]|nr:WD40 repeat-like protein [Gyrodon lividus]
MSTTRAPQSKSGISFSSPCSRGIISLGDAPDRDPSPSPSPFSRLRTPSPAPVPCSALRRSPRSFSTHLGSSNCGYPFEPRPSDLWLSNTPPRSQRHSPLASQQLHAPLEIDLLSFVTPQSGSSSSGSSAAVRREVTVTPPNLGLTLDLDFNSTLGLDFNSPSSPASTSAMSYVTAGSPVGSLLPSPGEDDVFRIRDTTTKDNPRMSSTEPPFEFSFVSRIDGAGAIQQPSHGRRESGGSSGLDSDLTFQLQPRSGSGAVKRDATSYGFAEQRYIRSSVPTPYYTANSTPEPDVDNEPRAGPSRLPFLDTNITVTTPSPTGCISSPSFPLSVTDASQSRESTSQRPPSPAPTADFSMISPPSSPSFYRYASQLAEDTETDPLRSPHRRGTATLPFFRSNSTSVASGVPGAFHFTVNGRTQSMSAGMGLGPVIGKPRRVRPGISWLWESLASPAKGSSLPLPVSQDAHLNPALPSRAKSSPMPGFSVRGKTSPIMGVGRKLKEKRRVKRSRRGTLEVDADVDYGALDPLDGEEGELVGCTCTGWGDGGCICGCGYWDVYDYGCEHTQEPESMGDGDSQPTPLTQLPTELFLQVLSYLPLRNILAVASTCKVWRALALDNSVWWGLWQAREGVPRVPSPGRNPYIGHRAQDSCGGFGRRYRGVKDEGVHGLSMPTTEHEHDGEQWDEPRGWTVNFDRANMRLKESARLGNGVAGTGVLISSAERRCQGHAQYSDTHAEEEGGAGCVSEQQEMMSASEPQPISRQAPLTLDWRTLYHGRSILEQRWRDPEGEPRVLRIDGHRDSVYCLDFDSSRIISGSRDRTIKVWCIKTGRCMATFKGHTGSVLCLKFERDWDLGSDGVCRGFMVSGSSDCTVCVWDLLSTPVTSGERNSVASIGGGRTGSWKNAATAGAGSFGPPRRVSAEIRKVLRGHSAGVLDLRMDERWIVTCSKDALMNVYDRKTLALHTVLRGHEGPVNAVGLENGRVVSASGDGKMMLWDVESGECVRAFDGHEKGLASIEFKNDLILSGSNDCTIKLWRASTGECLHTFAGHTLLVRALCFEPKTGYIVSTSYDRSVRVWEWREGAADDATSHPGADGNTRKTKGVGRLVREFRNLHASHIFDVKFDVGKIVSTSHDQQIVVLDFSYGIEGAELFA